MTMMLRDGAGLKAPEMIFVDGAWVAPLSAVEDPKTKPRKRAALLAFADILEVTRP